MTLDDRITEAVRRITRGDMPMRIPAEATDPDLVLEDCRAEIGRLTQVLATRDRVKGLAVDLAERWHREDVNAALEDLRERMAVRAEDYICDADLNCGTGCRDEVSAIGVELRAVPLVKP